MYCPECGSKSRVTDTYTQQKAVYRVRRCTGCDRLFSTRECLFTGPIPSRHSKDGKVKTTIQNASSPYTISCVLCDCQKCFKVGKNLVVCTNRKCRAYYVPVPKRLNVEGAEQYLKERKEKSNG